jgi:hypothetical protein
VIFLMELCFFTRADQRPIVEEIIPSALLGMRACKNFALLLAKHVTGGAVGGAALNACDLTRRAPVS